ncbi:MAG: hypothetical protein BWZ07_01485 [Alphaproteobacteria bacterium ADurb.BinA280]|nr:MAG: hypothetical protein BWZ07_01485 [Alphaproteobacteria bacterium ADurb.BinA280]
MLLPYRILLATSPVRKVPSAEMMLSPAPPVLLAIVLLLTMAAESPPERYSICTPAPSAAMALSAIKLLVTFIFPAPQSRMPVST